MDNKERVQEKFRYYQRLVEVEREYRALLNDYGREGARYALGKAHGFIEACKLMGLVEEE